MAKAASRVQRWYATDGDRDFLWEAYVLDGEHRARLSVICGHEGDFAVGVGKNETEALWTAWAAYQEKNRAAYPA